MRPTVSIAIPTYNGATHLRQSIESVLGQTFKDFELLIIDDVSTDETWPIVQEYGRLDRRVRTSRNSTRLGLVGNFNRCIDLANGRYICVWHQDDVMMPQNVERKVALLKANPRVGFVHSNILMIDEEGKVLSEHWERDTCRDYIMSGQEFFLKMIQPGKNYVCCPAVVARRECYQELGCFRSELYFACDWEMWMRISLYYDVGCLGEPLMQFRRHKGSESFRIEGTNSEIEQEVLAKHLVLAEHGHRITDAGRLKKKIIPGVCRAEMVNVRHAFAEGRSADSWRRLGYAVKLYPGLLWRPEFVGTLIRLLLGRRFVRWIKDAIVKQRLRASNG
jgi:glycosyltransferase involved in cell wall biosynthesis